MPGNTLADLMKGVYPVAQQEQQGAQQPTTLASLLPLDTPLQKTIVAGDQQGMPSLPTMPGVRKPADFQEYATTLGLQPGTDEYNEAVQDYVLRANGPTAQDGRESLEGVRQDNRVSLEGVRQGNRVALRGMPSYANLHPRPSAARSGGGNGGGAPRTTGTVYAPILAKIASGKGLTPGEQQVIGMYGRGGRGGRAGGAAQPQGAGPVATDGKGHKVQWNGRAWVPGR